MLFLNSPILVAVSLFDTLDAFQLDSNTDVRVFTGDIVRRTVHALTFRRNSVIINALRAHLLQKSPHDSPFNQITTPFFTKTCVIRVGFVIAFDIRTVDLFSFFGWMTGKQLKSRSELHRCFGLYLRRFRCGFFARGFVRRLTAHGLSVRAFDRLFITTD